MYHIVGKLSHAIFSYMDGYRQYYVEWNEWEGEDRQRMINLFVGYKGEKLAC